MFSFLSRKQSPASYENMRLDDVMVTIQCAKAPLMRRLRDINYQPTVEDLHMMCIIAESFWEGLCVAQYAHHRFEAEMNMGEKEEAR